MLLTAETLVTKSIEETRQHLAKKTGIVGLVPTMGYLHDGHRSLIKQARKECDVVVLSIFVNPLQFGANEDLDRYPQDLEQDLTMASDEKVDIVFCPTRDIMYPKSILTHVSVKGITDLLCGASRPGHFGGVATVVTKLFNIVQPDRAYFGLKDAQQVAVISQMVEDLNMPVDIIPCPIVREADGLAMSSRNVYLSSDERKQAAILYQTLQQSQTWIDEGLYNTAALKKKMEDMITTRPLAEIDYVEILTYPELELITNIEKQNIIIALAIKFGNTRLIDNVLIKREAVSHV
jgi:pantoate--beta-alanine ligase